MTEIKAVIRAKNKDYLIGFIDGILYYKSKCNQENLDITIKGEELLSSEKNDILGSHYLSLTCLCGNYVQFGCSSEIPDKNFKCTLCEENYFIYYTGE